MILFGSRKDNQFVLDTVFVVAESIDHTRETYAEVAAPRTNAVFRAVTLDPMYAWEGTRGGRLYLSADVDHPVNGMFSFVPCLPSGDGRVFRRPDIELPGLVTPTLAMAAKSTRFDDVEEIAGIWQNVATQVGEAGLRLGVRVDLPGRR